MTAELLIEPNSSTIQPLPVISHVPPLADSEPAVRRMSQYASLTLLPFLCVQIEARVVRSRTPFDYPEFVPEKVYRWLSVLEQPDILRMPSGLMFYAVPLPDSGGTRMAGVGCALCHPDRAPSDVILMAAERGWSKRQLQDWLDRQPYCQPMTLKQMLDLASERIETDHREQAWLCEIEQLSEQIDHTYEEITLLHDLARNLNISRSPSDLARLCLDRMQTLIHARGHLIWLDCDEENSAFLTEGDVPVSAPGLQRLITRCVRDRLGRPLVKNHIPGTLLGVDFPELENLVLVAIAEGGNRYGWILSCNLEGDREFGTIEASLLNSIATILGTHLRNIDLYQQHEELMFCFVRSLVSSLDARDPYTRGHSERVALVARCLGQHMGLPEDEVEKLYQSGLLHDIGKIGVDDEVLRKDGKLTDEEYRHIKEHPSIGHSILTGVKNLQHLLPGVRSHHENYNGGGYPDGLSGEQIPLMARIIAVADAYDAMCSDRPYRKGMPRERVEEILRGGAGSQWDAAIIDAYFDAKDEIAQICQEYSPQNLIQRAQEAHTAADV